MSRGRAAIPAFRSTSPGNGAPGSATMARIVADLHKLNDELRESGSWVFTGGLHAPPQLRL